METDEVKLTAARPFAIEAIRELGVALSEDDRDEWIGVLSRAFVDAHEAPDVEPPRDAAKGGEYADGWRAGLEALISLVEAWHAPHHVPTPKDVRMGHDDAVSAARVLIGHVPAPPPRAEAMTVEAEAGKLRDAWYLGQDWIAVARLARTFRAPAVSEASVVVDRAEWGKLMQLDAELSRSDGELRVTRDERDSLAANLAEAEQSVKEYHAMFDLYHAAEMRGIRLWQAEKPGRDLTWPDKGKLTAWLLDKLAAAERERDDARAEIERVRSDNRVLRANPALRTAPPAAQTCDVEAAAAEIAKADVDDVLDRVAVADIDRIAREGAELAGKATPPPWTFREDAKGIEGDAAIVAPDDRDVFTSGPFWSYADGYLTAHAGTHYAALCRAVVERGERIRELAAELDAQIARVRRYEETLTHRQRRVAHPDGTYTFEMDVERVGDLWNKLDAALRGKEGA